MIGTYKNPIMGLGEYGLVAAILFHAFNGLRIILVDFWSKGAKYQKQMLWIVVGLWVVLMVGFAAAPPHARLRRRVMTMIADPNPPPRPAAGRSPQRRTKRGNFEMWRLAVHARCPASCWSC